MQPVESFTEDSALQVVGAASGAGKVVRQVDYGMCGDVACIEFTRDNFMCCSVIGRAMLGWRGYFGHTSTCVIVSRPSRRVSRAS